MTSLLRQALVRFGTERRSSLSWDQYLSYFSFEGSQYPVTLQQTLTGSREDVERSFGGYISGAYRANAIVFACMLARFSLFAEARFQYRQLRSGRPGDLFGSPELAVLEKPWPGGTTGDLLSRMIVDADLAGTAFVGRTRERRDRIRRLRPDWVTMVFGSESKELEAWDPEADLVGVVYTPGGPGSGKEATVYLRDEVAVFAPIPDPFATYRGMSWLTPIVREIMGDSAATSHKLKFFENGATPNMVVKLDPAIPKEKFEEWVALFEKKEPTRTQAYKTLYLGGGADATVVGSDLHQLDFKVTQGAGETRIAAASGVGPIMAQLSEGLQGSSLNEGNWEAARHRFADLTIRPLWRNAAGSLEAIVPPPAGSQLWYDDRDIPFLQTDVKEAADVQGTESQSIRTLVDAGFTPESVIEAITSGDWKRLEHTNLFSVQLQPPSTSPGGSDDAGRALAKLIVPHLPQLTNGAHDA